MNHDGTEMLKLRVIVPCLSVRFAKYLRRKAIEGLDIVIITTNGSTCLEDHIRSLCLLGHWKKITFPRRLTPTYLYLMLLFVAILSTFHAVTKAEELLIGTVSSLLIASIYGSLLLLYVIVYFLIYIRPSMALKNKRNFQLCVFGESDSISFNESLLVIDNKAYVIGGIYIDDVREISHEDTREMDYHEALKVIEARLRSCEVEKRS